MRTRIPNFHTALGQRGFTLLEVCVASAISLVIIGTLLLMLQFASGVWIGSRGRGESFQSASRTFDAITRSLSQAVLCTYWSYDDPANPQQYVRASELHFVLGPTASLLNVPAADYPGQAVFFQAPEGKAPTSSSRLPSRLNAMGYFTSFGPHPHTPTLLRSVLPERYRFRLYEWIEPSSDMSVYQTTQGTDWFTGPLSVGLVNHADVAPVADNVLGLYIVADYPDANGSWVAADSYDTRDDANPTTLHQLPPRLKIALMAIDSASAVRLQQQYGETVPPVGPPTGAFTDPEHFDDDLTAWEAALRRHSPPINARVFRTTVQIPNSRWSIQ